MCRLKYPILYRGYLRFLTVCLYHSGSFNLVRRIYRCCLIINDLQTVLNCFLHKGLISSVPLLTHTHPHSAPRLIDLPSPVISLLPRPSLCAPPPPPSPASLLTPAPPSRGPRLHPVTSSVPLSPPMCLSLPLRPQLSMRVKALKRQVDDSEGEVERLEGVRRKVLRDLEEQQELQEGLHAKVTALEAELK